jgi:hypothetical protein
MSASLLDRAGHAHDIANERQRWAIDLFTTSSGNDRYLRIAAVHTDRSNPGSLQTDRLCPLISVIMFTGQLTSNTNRL